MSSYQQCPNGCMSAACSFNDECRLRFPSSSVPGLGTAASQPFHSISGPSRVLRVRYFHRFTSPALVKLSVASASAHRPRGDGAGMPFLVASCFRQVDEWTELGDGQASWSRTLGLPVISLHKRLSASCLCAGLSAP